MLGRCFASLFFAVAASAIETAVAGVNITIPIYRNKFC